MNQKRGLRGKGGGGGGGLGGSSKRAVSEEAGL